VNQTASNTVFSFGYIYDEKKYSSIDKPKLEKELKPLIFQDGPLFRYISNY